MQPETSYGSLLDKISDLRWSQLVNELNEWKYITQNALWLRGGYQAKTAHDCAAEYLQDLESRLKKHGYLGGALQTLIVPSQNSETEEYLLYDSAALQDSASIPNHFRVSEPQKWYQTISARADDWIYRLEELQKMVRDWIKQSGQSDLNLEILPSLKMYEELMDRFKVPARQMPVFRILKGSSQLVLFRPKALWVVGANGRVDLVTKTDVPMLIDASEPMSGRAHWKIFQKHRRNSVDFNYDYFSKLMNA